MPLEKFQFENIDQIDDGSVALAVNQALRAALIDCADRPELKKPRTVTLEIKMTPELEKGAFRYANVALSIKQSVPSKGIEVKMKPRAGGLEFQPAVSENPDQEPLPFEKDDE